MVTKVSFLMGVAMSTAAVELRQRVTLALQTQDMGQVTQLLEDIPPEGDAQLDQIASRLYIAWRKWPEAAAVLARLDRADPQNQLKLKLSRNLAAMQQHQPQVYQVIQDTPVAGIHRLHMLPTGYLTIARQRPGNATLFLSAAEDPNKVVQDYFNAIKGPWSKGQALGLCSVADGYFLKFIATTQPELPFNQTQAIHVFEPEVEVLMHTMMIHDYSGPDGPIAQKRFYWHVGPKWKEQYQQAMNQELFLPQPTVMLHLMGDDLGVTALVEDTQKVVNEQQVPIQNKLDAYYDQQLAQGMLAKLLGPNPPRKPRVQVMTSRFTTVLQHEARRITQAFVDMGWDARLLIETQDHHRMMAAGIRSAVQHFLPDFVFTLDHLRHEQGDLLPRSLPYVCWVQDLLPNIISTTAGQKVKDLEWVLTFCKPLLTGRYNYPADRCMDVPIMLASEPRLPQQWVSDGFDLAYASNLSQTVEAMVEHTIKTVVEDERQLMARCCNALVEHYAAGNSLPGKPDIGRLIAPVVEAYYRECGKQASGEPQIRALVDILWNPLNVGLYRQQALRWVAQIAREENLSLAIFGLGWENHPEFSAFARGVLVPGPEMQETIRRTRINLNLEPYACATHVRLLDGLTSGGFYLLRHHPVNIHLAELATFLNEHAPQAQTDDQALAQTPEPHRGELHRLISLNVSVSYDNPPDVVAQLRAYQRAGVLPQQGGDMLPQLPAVSFHDLESCRERIRTFIGDEAKRRQISQEQRAAVLERLTLKQGMQRLIDRMRSDMLLREARTESDNASTDSQAERRM